MGRAMLLGRRVVAGVVGLGLLATGASADVLNMGLGLTSLETVHVGNPGNPGELSGESAGGMGRDRICGSVDYDYYISKYEVTAAQYCEFLNAVAATDTYGLYDPNMSLDRYGCKIERSGEPGSFAYAVAPDWANRPVNHVTWGDAARFANWLHNGQPVGAQNDKTTEVGVYDLNGATTDWLLLTVDRRPGWRWAIPTEDEWYKAAYHSNDGPTPHYFDYPTGSNALPGFVNDAGDLSGTDQAFKEGGTDPGNYVTYNGDGRDPANGPYFRTEVGEWENSPSPYGTLDQGGNVWEWCETITGDRRVARGGSCFGIDEYLRSATLNAHSPASESRNLGFRVVFASVLLGDGNGDGQVDGNDLIAVEANFGATGEPFLFGDANLDGQVDGGDLITVEEWFGAVDPNGLSVPEPASVLLLVCGAALLRSRYQRSGGLRTSAP